MEKYRHLQFQARFLVDSLSFLLYSYSITNWRKQK